MITSPQPGRGWSSDLETRSDHLVLVRRAVEPEFRARLMRTAQLLDHGDHRGVEPLVSITDEDDATVLVTGFVGERSLTTSPPRHADELATLAATLAGLIAQIHRLGITHGSLTAGSVVFDAARRPVLCGFSDGQLRCDGDPLWEARCRSDRAALADVLEGCVTRLTEAPRWHPGTIRSRRRALGAIEALRNPDDDDRTLHPDPDDEAAESDTWSVRPGDHPWAIATMVLCDRSGRAPTDVEIDDYRDQLTEANAGELADPDVVLPGRLLRLP